MIRRIFVTADSGSIIERMRAPDMVQILALFLAALLFVLAVRWPAAGEPNEAWFALAQTRLTLLALTAMGFGAAECLRPASMRMATLAGLLMFVVVSVPFDVATYAASYPAVPFGWSLTLPFVEVPAYFGVGMVLGRAAQALRIGALLPLLVPAALVGGVALDVRLGVDLLDPLTAPLAVSWLHLVAMVVIGSATVGALTFGRQGDPGGNDAEVQP